MRAAPARRSGCLRAALLLTVLTTALQAQVRVNGRVVDENGAVVPGARVEFRQPGLVQAPSIVSDSQGRFEIGLPVPGQYALHAERPGFFVVERASMTLNEGVNEVTVALNHLREFVETVDVVYSAPVIDPADTTEQKQLNSVEILEVPYPASQDVRSALPLFSGVVQDNSGQLHFNGGASEQTNFNLDGFNISDPVTGLFEARLSIDAVRSLDLESARFAADKGRGSAGSLDIKTGMGDDRWRFGATNFIPGVSTERGLLLNKWTPRLTVSGPIARGRAWFQNGFDAFYDLDIVKELPPGKDQTRSFTTSNLSRFQVNLTPANILTGSFLVNYGDDDHHGLSFLDPQETTIHRRRTLHMATVKEQIYFQRGALVEFGFALSRGSTRETPLGSQTYEISPSGRRGNYFVDLDRDTRREQWIANAFLPPWKAAGQHQLKVGADLQRSGFDQKAGRHDYVVLRTDGSIAREVSFTGDGLLSKKNFESTLYIQDRWTPREGLLVEAGLRTDWDQIVRDMLFSPRLAVAWSPGWLRETKLAAGFGVFSDSLSLATLTRHQDQTSVARFFSRSGELMRGPIETSFLVDEQSLKVPRARIFSVSIERKLPCQFYGKAGYLRRSGIDGFTFVEPRMNVNPETVFYTLRNQRSDRYNALDFSVRRTFGGKFEWVSGYTYSRARSNAVVEYSLENPIFAPQAPGPVEWDTPHRFMMWGWAPLPRAILPPVLNWLLKDTNASYLAEARSGFPFSVVNEEGFSVGKPNERRLPYYFNINLHLERRFQFLNYLWAWRFGFNNLTNHGNPNVVNNNIDSPFFLNYGRGQHRAFSVRLRFLGRR